MAAPPPAAAKAATPARMSSKKVQPRLALVTIDASSACSCNVDVGFLVKYIKEDWGETGKVQVKTAVDKVESMKDKGQYIYVTVTGLEEGEAYIPAKPIVKFNNGIDGGSKAELFNEKYQAEPKGVLYALYKDKVYKEIHNALFPMPEKPVDEEPEEI